MTTAGNKICSLLAMAGFHIGILTVWKNGHEDFHCDDLPGGPVHDMQFLSRIVDIHLIARIMFQFHGSLGLCIFAVVMLHELGVTIGFFSMLHIFLVVEQKGKSGMVPCFIDSVKV